MKKQFIFILLTLLLSATGANAQSITVQAIPSNSIESFVHDMLDISCPDVDFFNISFTGDTNAIATFNNGHNIFIFNKGLLLCNGHYANALGPNEATDTSYNNTGGSDSSLALIGQGPISDACFLEFDFIPNVPHFSLRYSYASEDHNERIYSDSADVMGFFLTGPSPIGIGDYTNQNIALIPGISFPVNAFYVNHTNNPIFHFTNNGPQSSVEYDGFTTAMYAEAAVIPSETYHLKIAIGDVGDESFDSALFLHEAEYIPSQYIYSTQTNVSCFGQNDGIISIDSVFGIYSPGFTWSYSTVTANSISNLEHGNYTVTIESNNFISTPVSFTITEPDSLAVTHTSTPIDTLVSPYGSVDATVTGGTPPYGFAWSNGAITEDLAQAEYGQHELVITDSNGCIATAQIFVDYATSNHTSALPLANGIAIFPNPANDQINIQFANKLIENVACFSISGVEQFAMRSSGNKSIELDIKHLPKGTYILRINNKHIKRFVKL